MNGTLYGMAYVNFKQAAQYCGYKPDAFRKLISGYKLPKYGPNGNRYKLSDLDRFMEDPSEFSQQSRTYNTSKNMKVV